MKFLFCPAEDSSVDPEYQLRTDDDTDTGIAVQDGRSYGGGWAVTEHGGEGDDYWMSVENEGLPSLAKAKEKALALYANRKGSA